MSDLVSTRDLLLLICIAWLACALLSFLNGLVRRLHTYQWLLFSILLGPLALVAGLFIQGKGAHVSLFSRTDPGPAKGQAKRNVGDPFRGKPLYSDDVRELKRQGRLKEAVDLLVTLIDAIEEKARTGGKNVPAWYYEQLAVIYRKQGKLEAEKEILERYASRLTASSERRDKLLSRLERIRQKTR